MYKRQVLGGVTGGVTGGTVGFSVEFLSLKLEGSNSIHSFTERSGSVSTYHGELLLNPNSVFTF
ncbi:hypothetical protein JDS79_37950 [Bacillus cereus]|nr:hypothetical protein [Bacillus cereus]